MAGANAFKSITSKDAPLDTSTATNASDATSVSAFITTQSITNFAAMTGAIAAAWFALAKLFGFFSAIWVPYAFSGLFGFVSILISLEALKKEPGSDSKLAPRKIIPAIFMALINSLVLASAVVGASTVTGAIPKTGSP